MAFDLILHAKFTYKIYKPAVQSRAVVLVPIETARLLRIPKKLGETVGPSEPVIIRPGRTTEPARAASRGGAEVPPETSSAQAQAGVQSQVPQAAATGPPGQAGSQIAGGPAGALSSGFSLSYPKDTPLNLAKPSESSIDDLLRPSRYQARTDINFSKYVRPGISSAIPSGTGGVPGSGGRGGGQARRASVSINVRNYNLAPWASDVLNRIQRNWSVAQTGESHWKGEVGIFVLMAKNGELLAIELESTSKIDVLDQAAMKSLQLSAPFPALPADFPNASLEMIFAFHYGD